MRTAHPRSRGENFEATDKTVDDEGSSPLTRGKRRPEDQGRRIGRLIPAHAGKTHERVEVAGKAGAHPRSRGENWLAGESWALEAGSSPLTRGKPSQSGS